MLQAISRKAQVRQQKNINFVKQQKAYNKQLSGMDQNYFHINNYIQQPNLLLLSGVNYMDQMMRSVLSQTLSPVKPLNYKYSFCL